MGNHQVVQIAPDYPSSGLDIQPKIDEFRIVGSTGENLSGISSIRAGRWCYFYKNHYSYYYIMQFLDWMLILHLESEGIPAPGYNGQFVVTEKLSDTQLTYQAQNAPVNPLPAVTNAQLSLQSDTVTSASPYIFNISLRSVFGMCGLIADGEQGDRI
jgi:hypothetical protein